MDFLDPRKIQSHADWFPIMDSYTKIIFMLLLRHTKYEESSERPSCQICSLQAQDRIYTLPNGMTTTSLCVHMVAYHRHDVSTSNLQKLKKSKSIKVIYDKSPAKNLLLKAANGEFEKQEWYCTDSEELLKEHCQKNRLQEYKILQTTPGCGLVISIKAPDLFTCQVPGFGKTYYQALQNACSNAMNKNLGFLKDPVQEQWMLICSQIVQWLSNPDHDKNLIPFFNPDKLYEQNRIGLIACNFDELMFNDSETICQTMEDYISKLV